MMETLSAKQLWVKIDQAGAASKPFVFAIDYEMNDAYFSSQPFSNCGLFWEIDGVGNIDTMPICKVELHDDVEFSAFPISGKDYAQAFECVQSHLKRGNTFLANLTMPTRIETNCSFEEIFIRSNSRFKILIPNKLVCFSPETFINITANGRISSFPMKGTISGSIPDAEEIILNDYKETAEHFTIVDFIRSDISRIATSVSVDRLRYIDRLNTSKGEILQVSSEISGVLPYDWQRSLGATLRDLLPAGSISGAPKAATIEAIREAERRNRGFYTGVFGYFDGRELKTAVMIRYIERNHDGSLHFHSGGGITINSKCEEEYEEMKKKVYLPW